MVGTSTRSANEEGVVDSRHSATVDGFSSITVDNKDHPTEAAIDKSWQPGDVVKIN
jgi:hypothetical protein